ncbi:MAG TPA: SufD family Fe-S cluster assembly protein [Candidatus Limnocylindrales bacterium]|nr:SufD family Fe-S cluster assembly protein [Candidatus Limnocylindrales bacterium]
MSLARAPRAPRRAPSELTFAPDEAIIEAYAAAEPAWLADDRRAALELFRTLPTETNQLYTPYIDLRSADLASARAYADPAGAPDAAAGVAAAPVGSAAIAHLDEDRIAALVVDDDARAAGVTVETLGGLIGRDPEAGRRLLTDAVSLPADDRLAQLTRAAWNQGVAIRVPDGVRLERPIVVRWTAGAPDTALLTRTVVELGDGAAASIVEEFGASGRANRSAAQALFTSSLEVRLGRSAELAVASIQDFAPNQVVFQHRHASIGEASTLHWALAQLGGRLVRSRVDNVLAGDRSSVEQVEIVFGADEQLFDLTSYTRHVGRDTTGNLLSKGVLMDAARTYLKGMITIDKTAIGTDSFLGEFGMNLSKKARSVAIPSLEIDQPDCRRAAHSSSVGPIDETQLFYLESRGIPPDEARKFIVLGFLEPVVARVPLEAERERLRELLEAKWASGTEGAAAA